ncbi:MAG: flippase-like domain-containing protein [Cellulomonas sp.]|uniref:lysylphosphatidylglycerol synthase domain-containing protein n=1 Tax=Cellulomonas sp. TaxID=40001 RepID=UPI0019FAE13A|nr:lysylphosphatidylglycerol synthase domain-containing protein [Cellulomonas sp.]MBF0686355.1 flippase-like domain-containing protein [Cellulomonas sp.]MBF0687203.1 flippase-like domain-containing protein [Cellulomonas sp.]
MTSRTWIQIGFSAVVVVAVAVYLVRIDWAQLEGLHLSAAPLAAATVLALGFRYWGALVWLHLLRRLGARDVHRSARELSYVYAKAWLGRYVLGAGTWIVGKVYFAAQHGVSRSKLAVSGTLEAALQLISTLLVGLALLALDPRLDALGGRATVLSAVAAGVCLLALAPPVLRRLLDLAYRLARRRLPAEDRPTWSLVLSGGGLYVLGTLLTGASYYLLARAVYSDLPWSDLAYVVGAASIASAVSMLAVFAPGGLGVREGVQALFLSALMPLEAAVVVTVLTRLWSVAVDVLFLACAAALRPRGGAPRTVPASSGTTGDGS